MEKNETMITAEWLRERGAPQYMQEWFANLGSDGGFRPGGGAGAKLTPAKVFENLEYSAGSRERNFPPGAPDPAAVIVWKTWLDAELAKPGSSQAPDELFGDPGIEELHKGDFIGSVGEIAVLYNRRDPDGQIVVDLIKNATPFKKDFLLPKVSDDKAVILQAAEKRIGEAFGEEAPVGVGYRYWARGRIDGLYSVQAHVDMGGNVLPDKAVQANRDGFATLAEADDYADGLNAALGIKHNSPLSRNAAPAPGATDLQGQVAEMREQITSAIMATVKPVLTSQNDAIVTVSDTVAELAHELRDKDRMVNKLTAQVAELQTSYQRATAELPSYLKQAPEITRFVADVNSQVAALTNLAYHDQLTSLGNRQYLSKFLSSGQGAVLSAVVDIDHFKRVNDSYGHNVGDDVLKGVAHQIVKSAREAYGAGADIKVLRVGGEEFAVMKAVSLGDTGMDLHAEAKFFLDGLERVKQDVSKIRFTADGKQFGCTVSIGVNSSLIQLPVPEDSGRRGLEAFGDADEKLYLAKGNGRDLVACDIKALTANIDRLMPDQEQTQGVGRGR